MAASIKYVRTEGGGAQKICPILRTNSTENDEGKKGTYFHGSPLILTCTMKQNAKKHNMRLRMSFSGLPQREFNLLLVPTSWSIHFSSTRMLWMWSNLATTGIGLNRESTWARICRCKINQNNSWGRYYYDNCTIMGWGRSQKNISLTMTGKEKWGLMRHPRYPSCYLYWITFGKSFKGPAPTGKGRQINYDSKSQCGGERIAAWKEGKKEGPGTREQ